LISFNGRHYQHLPLSGKRAVLACFLNQAKANAIALNTNDNMLEIKLTLIISMTRGKLSTQNSYNRSTDRYRSVFHRSRFNGRGSV
jgi:hypothetical protein